MWNFDENMTNFLQDLRERGYTLLEQAGQSGLDDAIARLGRVIQMTDVRNNPNTPALVTSTRALDFHTDHPKADYIAWLCIEPSASGGESILADAEMAFSHLSPSEQDALAGIRLFEHKVFPDDQDSRPLISLANGRKLFYYSFWLVEDDLPSVQRNALNHFRKAVRECQIAEIKLRKDDILIVENSRVFHGRRAFEGEERHLRRYWISRFCSNTSQTGGKP